MGGRGKDERAGERWEEGEVMDFGAKEEWRMVDLMISSKKLPYSGKLSREKTFMNFAVLWLCMKVFSAKFVAVVSFAMAKASNLRMLSLQKLYFHQFAMSKVSRYTVLSW